jgi:hypothetical protein
MATHGLVAILRDARTGQRKSAAGSTLLRMRATNTNLILRSGPLAASRRMAAAREPAAISL